MSTLDRPLTSSVVTFEATVEAINAQVTGTGLGGRLDVVRAGERLPPVIPLPQSEEDVEWHPISDGLTALGRRSEPDLMCRANRFFVESIGQTGGDSNLLHAPVGGNQNAGVNDTLNLVLSCFLGVVGSRIVQRNRF